MYWSELGSRSIKRAAMDGSSPTIFMEQVGRVHSLALDYDKRALFWAAVDPAVIEFVYLNGSGRKLLVENLTVPYALTLYNDKVIWGDWRTGKAFKIILVHATMVYYLILLNVCIMFPPLYYKSYTSML